MCKFYGQSFTKDNNPFFVEGAGQTYDRARAICAGCPVVVDCLLSIIDDRGAIGFWGGTTPNERHSIRRFMDNGTDFVKAVETVWKENRRKRIAVPSHIVWGDWE